MGDEGIVVVSILGGIGLMIPTLVLWQRRKEARLAAKERIELPIESMGRTILVMLAAILVLPVGVGLVGTFANDWMRHHALGMTLGSIGGTLAVLLLAMTGTGRLRSVGRLVLDAGRLELEERGQPASWIALDRPFEMLEARSGPDGLGMLAQVVALRQEDRALAFSYLVPVQGHGMLRGRRIDAPIGPLLSGECRVLHDRLRAAPTCRPVAPDGEPGVLEA